MFYLKIYFCYLYKKRSEKVRKVSNEALQKRIKKAEKIHNNKFLTWLYWLFMDKDYVEYKEKLVQKSYSV